MSNDYNDANKCPKSQKKKKSVTSACFNRRGRETCFYYYHNIGTYVIIIAFAISCILGCDHYNLDWSDHIYI